MVLLVVTFCLGFVISFKFAISSFLDSVIHSTLVLLNFVFNPHLVDYISHFVSYFDVVFVNDWWNVSNFWNYSMVNINNLII